jgi:tetratricopeptide (TPR) repeat protein
MELALIMQGVILLYTVNPGLIRARFRQYIPGLTLLAVFAVSYIGSENPSSSISQLDRMLFSVFAYIAADMSFSRFRSLSLKPFLFMAVLISVYALMQRSGGIMYLRVPQMKRVFSTFGNPNFFASFLAGSIPLAAVLFVAPGKKYLMLLPVIMLSALYCTGTRGAWIGIIISSIVFSVFFYGGKGKKKILTILACIILALLFLTKEQWGRKTERLMIWRDSMAIVKDNPIRGIGIGNFYSRFPAYASDDLLEILPKGKYIVNYTHNEFIELAVETGLAGLGIYLWFLFTAFAAALKNNRGDINKMAALAGALAIIIHSSVSVNMRFSISSIWAFFLVGYAGSPDTVPLKKGEVPLYKNNLLGPMFFLFSILCVYWGYTVTEPLRSSGKLKKEVAFFDSEKEYSEAELKRIISEDPENAMAYYKLGWIEAKARDFKSAITNFKKALEYDPKMVGALNNLGNIYYTIGDRKAAEIHYIRALELNPGLVDAHFNLGYIYYYQGRLEEAAGEFDRVLELDPDNFKARIMLKKMVQ